MKCNMPRVHQLDISALQPCEPAGAVLDALDRLAPGEQLRLLIDSEPFPLYRILSNRAYAYCASALADTLYEVTIWRCGAKAA
jgi:uncharacterized protein (DUF2249 family)